MLAATATLLLVVRIYDTYGLAARDFESAVGELVEALRQAGVETLAVPCSAAKRDARCTALPGPSELFVRIVRGSDRSGTFHVLGSAAVDSDARSGALATVYGDRIALMATRSSIDNGVLVGRAMAHELGHLLLGTTSHAKEGLMRARWSADDRRNQFLRSWRFSTSEKRLIRAALEKRISGGGVIALATPSEILE